VLSSGKLKEDTTSFFLCFLADAIMHDAFFIICISKFLMQFARERECTSSDVGRNPHPPFCHVAFKLLSTPLFFKFHPLADDREFSHPNNNQKDVLEKSVIGCSKKKA
jgi:hypothetical protein